MIFLTIKNFGHIFYVFFTVKLNFSKQFIFVMDITAFLCPTTIICKNFISYNTVFAVCTDIFVVECMTAV